MTDLKLTQLLSLTFHQPEFNHNDTIHAKEAEKMHSGRAPRKKGRARVLLRSNMLSHKKGSVTAKQKILQT